MARSSRPGLPAVVTLTAVTESGDGSVLFIGAPTTQATTLADAVDSSIVLSTPAPPDTPTWSWNWRETIEAWRASVADGPLVDQVVVCTWPSSVSITPVIELEPSEWRAQVEWPLALWFQALAVATQRCADGGSVVVVVEIPAAVDSVGQGAVVAVAEGIEALVRSLAASEGRRSVRVNAVTTELFTAPDLLPGAPPPLPTFPGRIDVDVAGAVRLLLSPASVGITGTSLRAAGGRS